MIILNLSKSMLAIYAHPLEKVNLAVFFVEGCKMSIFCIV